MIYRYWWGPTEPPPPSRYAGMLIDSLHPGELADLTDDDLPPDWLPWLEERSQMVTEADRPRHRGNLVRWRLLAERGGVWLDHDVILLQPLRTGPWVASYHASACTCVMSFPLGHPTPLNALSRIEQAGLEPTDKSSAEVSGDLLLRALDNTTMRRPIPFGPQGQLLEGMPWCVHTVGTGTARLPYREAP